ncbi:mechanosensitive ion channel family protein [uncultured Psychrosphaera sp.]|jgi:MscS family membrane protein|uniref:mechanosensitive ion channel family protein n=1 Tax=uncultured Psychrosphaera sp. TaxID=1403522 RepID=UPI0026305603|nr:mechanosensitive ion channel family protein [uncultured Psychrosphaera sp.]
MLEDALYLFDPNQDYFSQLMAVILILSGIVILRLFKSKLLNQTSGTFVSVCINSIYKPAKFLLFTSAIWSIIAVCDVIFSLNLGLEEHSVLQIILAVHISWYGFRIVNNYEKITLTGDGSGKLDTTAVIGLAKIGRLLLTLILVIVAFDLLGLDATGLIAMGSVSGAALAFASKDLVSNWFGGIMLYLDKPFQVGDWIRSPDRDIEGTVEYIGWRITKIRAFDKRPLYVPNSAFNTITVQNPSRMTHRRIEETITVRYDDMKLVNKIVEQITQYLNESELVAQDQTKIVNFNGYGESSLNILIYCMTITTDWVTFHQHKQKVLLDIGDIVLGLGGDFAYPTQRLQVEQAES